MKKKRIAFGIIIFIIVGILGVFTYKIIRDPKIEDYNYFWETLEEAFPYYSFLNEDNRLEKIKEEHKVKLDDLDYGNKDKIINFYNNIIYNITNGRTIAHLGAYEKGQYMSLLKYSYLYEEINKLQKEEQIEYFYKSFGGDKKSIEKDLEEILQSLKYEEKKLDSIVQNKRIQAFYNITEEDTKYLRNTVKKELGLEAENNSTLKAAEAYMNSNIEKSIYIRLYSFDPTATDDDCYNRIINFIKSNNEKENLIIDIRGNGGGDSQYWMRIMKYLIKKPESAKSISLFKENKILEKYYKVPKDYRKYIRDLDEKDIVKFKYSKDFDFILEKTGTSLKPFGEEPIFNGRIWVLVDEGVYSAAMDFMDFCNSIDYITTVGRNAGGGMNVGDCYLALPNCGLVYIFDLSVRLNKEFLPTDIYGVSPDIYTEDDALEYVKKEIEK
ncbi:S41 family peptidase [Miniphocaeibacter halophilus]|uniref:Uncharacterized protein n=1 Tax=Miniphocaeibacter halophilus TaxID=2931922 RepID=A0AC61MT31_9FIRM|nr:S41 family peptidase [Miniphocaeibacter halophilus]QQK08845.1 hypothetical protein JFY71_04735 [Miniphocaeibacter halophilus]